MSDHQCYLLGEHAIAFVLETSNPSSNEQRRLFALTSTLMNLGAFFDVVPAKSSITVYLKTPQDHPIWIKRITTLWHECEMASFKPTTHRFTVKYGGDYGPDLSSLANTLSLPEKDLIELHASVTYQVEFLGFLPGFGYLGTLPNALQVPRKKTPRTRVPKGSVAIAQELTAIYPSSSPGGWHLLGICDTPLFNPSLQQPSLLMPGDHVQFIPSKGGLCSQ
ncbi:5-oxoprolinase subunit PxpB [Pseudoalteromonas aurantia]|uniref:Carboxylase n=1 Tax=Pseudoalteromonas aurantia TaxID=43654 RepID=A0A5S3V831_9GAMM|nr:5-oxoprolinase subunit PxpB [Pseudoalteromonas aurantia]TMO65376.1 carboxylase [Pseudoalteromonas aurantia]TMO67844.1 carboxylase [Pseudoalteromonas aurantia]TMO78213.1 carboxylase [Pseudoalteromonas aurantia]